MAKAKKPKPDAPVVRKCHYCGEDTTCPKKQPYAPSDPHIARWTHAPRPVEVVPLCELARRTMEKMEKEKGTP